mgnify:CR=1 FL=1
MLRTFILTNQSHLPTLGTGGRACVKNWKRLAVSDNLASNFSGSLAILVSISHHLDSFSLIFSWYIGLASLSSDGMT